MTKRLLRRRSSMIESVDCSDRITLQQMLLAELMSLFGDTVVVGISTLP